MGFNNMTGAGCWVPGQVTLSQIPRTEHPEPRTIFQHSSNHKQLMVQSTKYQYTILDLLQERIIFLHLEQLNLRFLNILKSLKLISDGKG
jgi:hypothetical protein